MNVSGRVLSASVVLVLCANLSSACTSMRTIARVSDPNAAPFGLVKSGDHVALRLRDGRSETLIVQSVTAENLVSTSGHQYARNDIVELKRRSRSTMKSTLLVSGIAVGTIFLVAALVAASGLPLY